MVNPDPQIVVPPSLKKRVLCSLLLQLGSFHFPRRVIISSIIVLMPGMNPSIAATRLETGILVHSQIYSTLLSSISVPHYGPPVVVCAHVRVFSSTSLFEMFVEGSRRYWLRLLSDFWSGLSHLEVGFRENDVYFRGCLLIIGQETRCRAMVFDNPRAGRSSSLFQVAEQIGGTPDGDVLVDDFRVVCASRVRVGHYRRIDVEPGTTSRRF